jgi:hypothetical protein
MSINDTEYTTNATGCATTECTTNATECATTECTTNAIECTTNATECMTNSYRVYDDVVPVLRQIVADGIKVYSYSADTVESQKLLFGFTNQGDISEVAALRLATLLLLYSLYHWAGVWFFNASLIFEIELSLQLSRIQTLQ